MTGIIAGTRELRDVRGSGRFSVGRRGATARGSMAHRWRRELVATVERIVSAYFYGTRGLEVGTLDVNGRGGPVVVAGTTWGGATYRLGHASRWYVRRYANNEPGHDVDVACYGRICRTGARRGVRGRSDGVAFSGSHLRAL